MSDKVKNSGRTYLRVILILLVSSSLCVVTFLYCRQRQIDEQTRDKKEGIMNIFTASLRNNSGEETQETEPPDRIEAGPLGIMTIEKLGVQAPIDIGFEEETLRYQIGSYPNTDDFGMLGSNVGFTAHSATFACSYCYFDQIDQ